MNLDHLKQKQYKRKPGEALLSYGKDCERCGHIASECICDMLYQDMVDDQISKR